MRLAPELAAIGLAIVAVFSLPARAQKNGPAQTLFESANHERTGRGLAPLKWSATLAVAARQHALRMAARNTLSHQLPASRGWLTEPPKQARASAHSRKILPRAPAQ